MSPRCYLIFIVTAYTFSFSGCARPADRPPFQEITAPVCRGIGEVFSIELEDCSVEAVVAALESRFRGRTDAYESLNELEMKLSTPDPEINRYETKDDEAVRRIHFEFSGKLSDEEGYYQIVSVTVTLSSDGSVAKVGGYIYIFGENFLKYLDYIRK